MEGCIILNATAKSSVWVHLGFPGNADGTVLTKKSVIYRTCSQKCHIRQHIILQYIAIYRIARDFRGLKFSRFLWIWITPRKFYPRPRNVLHCNTCYSNWHASCFSSLPILSDLRQINDTTWSLWSSLSIGSFIWNVTDYYSWSCHSDSKRIPMVIRFPNTWQLLTDAATQISLYTW